MSVPRDPSDDESKYYPEGPFNTVFHDFEPSSENSSEDTPPFNSPYSIFVDSRFQEKLQYLISQQTKEDDEDWNTQRDKRKLPIENAEELNKKRKF